MKPRKLNGTTLEGGGQLVRLSVCLSALTGQPIQIDKIRGNRDGGGGLKEQHLSCVKWLAQACDATVEGMAHKSKTLKFEPGTRRDRWWEHATIERDGHTLQVRATTAQLATSGAVTLVLQAILPFLLFAGAESASSTTSDLGSLKESFSHLRLQPSDITSPDPILLTLNGGTNVSNSPSIDYVTQVLLPNLRLLGLPLVELFGSGHDTEARFKRGWATGRPSIGTATLLIFPFPHGATLPALVYPPRGDVTKLTITMLASQDIRAYLRTHCVVELSSRFCPSDDLKSKAKKSPSPEIEVLNDEDSGHPKRLHLLIVAHTSSGFRLGSDCLIAERMGSSAQERETAAKRLVERAIVGLGIELNSGRCVDEWMEDQVVVFQALAKGQIENPPEAESTTNRIEVRANGANEAIWLERECMRWGKPVSLHTRTVRWVASELLGVEFDDYGRCDGIGYVTGQGIPKS